MSEAQQEQPADAWGQPISEERQREVQGYLDRWAAEKEHVERRGPYDSVRLSGADVAWLAEQLGLDKYRGAPNLHLEGANLSRTYLEGANLAYAHLEGVNFGGSHLRQSKFDNAHLERANLYSAHLEQSSLTGAHLEEALLAAFLNDATLLQAHMERARLEGAHFEGANLELAHFEGADLAYAKLQGANLTGASFDKATTLNGAVLTGALLDKVTFDNTNLSVVDWRAVPKLGDELEARRPKDTGGKRKSRSACLDNYRAAVRANRRLAVALQANGLSEDAGRYTYRAQLCQRSVAFYERRYLAWLGSWFLAALAGYGYRPGRTILWYLAVVSGFALAFFLFGPSSAVHLTWNEALVVSLTAFHGRGFFANTFQPGDPLAAIAAGEAVIGLLIEISFIATFTQRFFNSR